MAAGGRVNFYVGAQKKPAVPSGTAGHNEQTPDGDHREVNFQDYKISLKVGAGLKETVLLAGILIVSPVWG